MNRLLLVLKGACMGLADIIPGVSGGTMALVLGIYVQFINALRSVNLRWLGGLVRWARSGFRSEERARVTEPLRAIHWGFLLPLAAGIGSAIVVGSRTIPPLIENHPRVMFAFFFGLILASVALPWLQMNRRGPREYLAVLVFAAAAFLLVGNHAQPVFSWTTAQAEEDLTLEAFTRAHPSAWNPQQLFCNPGGQDGNRDLRAAVAQQDVERADQLLELCAQLIRSSDIPAVYMRLIEEHHLDRKDPRNPFNALLVPAGTPVELPRPALWFMFAAGLIAISAMLLPGISGSFILLILGAYYFILVSLKGFLDGLVTLSPSPLHTAYVTAFAAGMVIGLFSFARILGWLFDRYASITLAAMVGLMLGSLRVIWPFKLGDPAVGVVENVLPTAEDLLPGPLAAFLVGFALVSALTWVEVNARRRGQRGGIHDVHMPPEESRP